MADKYFALDIGESYLKIVEVKKIGSQFELIQIGMIEIDKTFFTTESDKILSAESAKLAKFINQLKITKRNVRLVLSDSQTFNQIVQLPRLNEKELLSAIRYQADQFIPMPLDEINIDLEILSEDKKKNKIETLISAAPKKVVEKVQILVEQAGLLPESVESEISAIGRFLSVVYKKDPSKKNRGLLFINLNAQTTSLYLFDLESCLILASRNFQTGYDLFVREITVNLNLEPLKAKQLLHTFGITSGGSHQLSAILQPALKQFLAEVQKFIVSLKEKNQSQIESIFFMNQATQFPALDAIVGRYFALPASLFKAEQFFKSSSILDANKQILPFMLPAIGANLR